MFKPNNSSKDIHLVVVFLAITFFITWSIIGSYVFFPAWMGRTFGEISGVHPLFFIATWAPAIAALAIVFNYRGFPGLNGFFSRLLIWRCPPTWWLFILIVIPLIFISGSLIKGGGGFAEFGHNSWLSVLPTFFMMLLLGPIEEFGWRGFLQPVLQRYASPLFVGFLIGVIWGVWHLPAFYLSGVVFSDWHFLPFFVGNIMLAVLVTPLFNASKGSLLLPIIFHWQLINPYWPDAQPWDTWLLLLVTILIVFFNQRQLLNKKSASKSVLSEDSMVPDL